MEEKEFITDEDKTSHSSVISRLDPITARNVCGDPYVISKGKSPVFPCYFDFPSRYVIFTLQPTSIYGIQLCEVQVFGKSLLYIVNHAHTWNHGLIVYR